MHETSPEPSRSLFRSSTLLACTLAAFTWTGCSGSGGGGGSELDVSSTNVTLTAVHHGKLVDVYGLRTVGGNRVIELYQTDMLAGLDIVDQRDANSNKADEEVLYDFLSANPDNLQPRLLITREIGSEEFNEAVDNLDLNLRLVSPNQFGRDARVTPYSVVPRNAALRLTFSGALGITDDFFYSKDANGQITGVKNAEAIQLLKISGDPNDTNYANDFEQIDVRLAVRNNVIIVDPVLLGTEGLQFGSRNTASGMPASADQRGANIRLALALEGPLSLGKIAADVGGTLSGRNNNAQVSVIRDFRSGNSADNSPDLARGFIRDAEPPRIIGEMLTYVERVEPVNELVRLVTIFKDGIIHEIDRGDQLRIQLGNQSVPIASLEVLTDPEDDLGKPDVQRVRCLVRPVIGPNGEDVLENLDPTNDPSFPTTGDRRAWLRRNAPRAIVVAEFTNSRPHPDPAGSGLDFYGDDPRNFITFNPTPLPDSNGFVGAANENISPFAGAIVRFNKPIDMASVIALDTAFFATRNVLDEDAIDEFVTTRSIDPTRFNAEKFKTPHMLHSRIFDENGSQTAVRVQPTVGFYLDDVMRTQATEDENKPFEERRNHYFLHLVGGPDGVKDLSGNPLDFQTDPNAGGAIDNMVIEFSIDTRNRPGTTDPWFEDNIVAYVVRRFADPDEDEKPNYYLDTEIARVGQPTSPAAWRSDDFFGPVSYLTTGELVARPASRTQRVVDNINQISPPAQSSNLRWCPVTGPTAFASGEQIVNQTAATPFGQPIQNPLNPFGCRLQTVWREIDMSLSRTDPLDFNLDVEQMYWAPFTGNPIYFDEFDRVSLFLGHSERRPEACIASGSAFPTFPNSGLNTNFQSNYAKNLDVSGGIDRQPERHPAFTESVLTINSKDAILEPRGVNRFLPLPKFTDATLTSTTIQDKYFVWRNEQEIVQGGVSEVDQNALSPFPYLLGPFLGGRGSRTVLLNGNVEFADGNWYNGLDKQLSGNRIERITDGLTGTVALPLLADFWVYPDSAELPASDPFQASGVNGWQISLAVTSIATPNFRAYSAGRGGASPIRIGPSHRNWENASGGYTPTGGSTGARDNSVYWIMADFVKRTAVVTAGFVEIKDPHRMQGSVNTDPRLGPYNVGDATASYSYDFEPPLSSLPAGTSVVTEFRGASELDTVRSGQPWPIPTSAMTTNAPNPTIVPNPVTTANFPLDPMKSGDAHIRHFDNRSIPGTSISRQWWTYTYNRTVTSYTEDPNDLARTEFTNSFSGPNETFRAEDVRYFNWRFIMNNNIDANPPVSPAVESFAVSYRFNKR